LSTFRTFCCDLTTALNSGGPYYVPVAVTTTDAYKDAQGNTRDIGAAGWVVNNYASASNDALGALIGKGPGVVTSAEANTALQMAVWKAAYNDGNNDVTATHASDPTSTIWFTGADSIAFSIANAILHNRNGQTSAVGFIRYEPNSQDMLFAVPEPSALAIAGLGALGFLGYGWRRRKRA
jgi:hypothetical protein